MELIFGPDDDDAFNRARDVLIEGFAAWLAARNTETRGDVTSDAELLLDWKFGYDDGDLLTWTPLHFDEFLIAWVPRKVMIDTDSAARIPSNLSLFMLFLAATGQLSRRSSSVSAIEKHLRRLQPQFMRAIGDSSKFGMGKSMLSGMSALGLDVDPDYPKSIDTLMQTFNGLPFDVRGAMLGLPDDDDETEDEWDDDWDPFADMELPPALILSPEDLNARIADSRSMQAFNVIAEFFATARKLTQAGYLVVSDAKSLAALLGTDEALRSSGRPIRSSQDLGTTSMFVEWAIGVGVVRKVKGTLVHTAVWAKLSPAKRHERVLTDLIHDGPIQTVALAGWRQRVIEATIDSGTIALLAALYANEANPTSYNELLAVATVTVRQETPGLARMTDDILAKIVESSFRTFCGAFELLGVLEVREIPHLLDQMAATIGDSKTNFDAALASALGTVVPIDSLPIDPPSTTALVVTELGRATLPAQLARRGLNIPVVGLLANGPLDEIIAKIGAWPRSRVEGEVKAWAGVNSPESAATELRRIVLASSDPQTRMACVDLTGQLGPLAESAVTSLLNTRARGHAVNWLNQHGLLADDDVDFEARTLAMLEMLSMHATGNPDDEPALAQMIKNLFTAVPSTELLNSLWRVPEAWAGDLLAAIGRLSSDRAVAKAARKGVMQHRTHIANMRNN